jgi:hypothetical protein
VASASSASSSNPSPDHPPGRVGTRLVMCDPHAIRCVIRDKFWHGGGFCCPLKKSCSVRWMRC